MFFVLHFKLTVSAEASEKQCKNVPEQETTPGPRFTKMQDLETPTKRSEAI